MVIGENSLHEDAFMKNLSAEAQLSSSEYTNHSIRGTVLSNLDEEGFDSRHIIAVNGHRSKNTIKNYSKVAPVKQITKCLTPYAM